MRTTLSLDPEVLSAARKIAAARSTSISAVISGLARRGLEARVRGDLRRGVPVFSVPKNAATLSAEDVFQDADEE